jgi:hypothetical protein
MDWHPLPGQWIEVANELNIPTMVVVSEGFFPDANRWYTANCLFDKQEFDQLVKLNLTQEKAKPIAKYVACWSLMQRQVFLDRGTDPKQLFVTGQPRLDRFKKQTRLNEEGQEEVIAFCKDSSETYSKKIGNKENKPVVTFCCQAMDTDAHGVARWQAQRDVVLELLKIARKSDIFINIRNHPIIGKDGLDKGGPKSFIPIWEEIQKGVQEGICFFDGEAPHQHVIDPYDAIYHSGLILAQSSTTLFQALLLNVMPVIVDTSTEGAKDPLGFAPKGGMKLVEDLQELEAAVIEGLEGKIDLTEEQLNFFLVNYLPCVFDGQNGARVCDVMNYAFTSSSLLNQAEGQLFEQFRKQRMKLIDPLHHLKEEAEAALNQENE